MKYFLYPFLFLLPVLSLSSIRQAGRNIEYQEKTVKVDQAEIRGEYLKAFQVAFQAFKEDDTLPDHKKLIENYGVLFWQDGPLIIVTFTPNRTVKDRNLRGGESELGAGAMFAVNRKDFKLLQWGFTK